MVGDLVFLEAGAKVHHIHTLLSSELPLGSSGWRVCEGK